MPPPWCPFRCLVFLLLAAAAGFLPHPAEAAKRPFADIVDAAAERHGVDPDLVHAVIAVESGYRATAQSPAGAQGLMQLMPGTQRDLGVSDAFDPRQNVDAGVAYLRRLTDEFGTVLALAAYNAGPGAVRRYNGIPPYAQTRAYVQAVLDRDRPVAGAQAEALRQGVADERPIQVDGASQIHTAPSPAADAVKRQDSAALQALLQEGADVDQPQGDGATALHWAVYRDDLETTRLLLAAGATVGAANDLGVTPLWLACNNGSAALVEALLVAGADPDAALPSGETPLMTAARTGNAGAARLLLAHGADANAREGAHGQTALMWAVSQRHPKVVRVLLEHGAGVNDRSNAYPQVVSSAGNADPRGVFEVMQGGYAPLLFAARQGDLQSARLLLAAGADVDDAAASGTSALVVAAHSGHGTLAALLLEAGADPGAAGAGYSALHAAVLRGDLGLVRTLLAHGADPDAVLERGTPARRVSADWTLRHAMIGATPFWLAARFREPEIMRVLSEHGADPRVVKDGETAVTAAIQGGTTRGRFGIQPPDPDEEGRRTLQAVALALDMGADVNAQIESGDTALHLATSRGLSDVIRLLAERGAALDARNARGQTPLGVATSDTVALLRDLGTTGEDVPPAASPQ